MCQGPVPRSAIHEIGIICEDLALVNNMAELINIESPNNKAETWGQIAPELGFAQEIMGKRFIRTRRV